LWLNSVLANWSGVPNHFFRTLTSDELDRLDELNSVRGTVNVAFADCDLSPDQVREATARLDNCKLFRVIDGEMFALSGGTRRRPRFAGAISPNQRTARQRRLPDDLKWKGHGRRAVKPDRCLVLIAFRECSWLSHVSNPNLESCLSFDALHSDVDGFREHCAISADTRCYETGGIEVADGPFGVTNSRGRSRGGPPPMGIAGNIVLP